MITDIVISLQGDISHVSSYCVWPSMFWLVANYLAFIVNLKFMDCYRQSFVPQFVIVISIVNEHIFFKPHLRGIIVCSPSLLCALQKNVFSVVGIQMHIFRLHPQCALIVCTTLSVKFISSPSFAIILCVVRVIRIVVTGMTTTHCSDHLGLTEVSVLGVSIGKAQFGRFQCSVHHLHSQCSPVLL